MIRVGALCQIKDCKEIPGVHGVLGQIVDMQIQEDYVYTTYPLWIKILSGEKSGKVYGFKYEEVADAREFLRSVPAMVVA